jgi:hypothetical protein
MKVEGDATNWCFRLHPRLESEEARLRPADALLADSTCLRFEARSGTSRKCILRQHLGEYNQRRTVELINQYGSKDLVRVALGTRNGSLGQRFRQK